MAHYDVVLDLGVDYGADGGLGWQTTVVAWPNGRSVRNALMADAHGAWQLGNRRLDVAERDQIAGFFAAMRGQLHTFLYRDWSDHRAVDEPLVADGGAVTQLIKTYGLSINAWVRAIVKPDAASVVIEHDTGGGFAALTAGVDYTLDASSGLVTWLISPPDVPDQLRWSGEFFVRARFDRDRYDEQFIARREDDEESLYELGPLGVIEDADA